MANHPSAEKRNRQRLARTDRNRQVRSTLRTTLKAARQAIEAGDAGAAASKVQDAKSALAGAASRGVIHARTASRATSRIQLALNKISS